MAEVSETGSVLAWDSILCRWLESSVARIELVYSKASNTAEMTYRRFKLNSPEARLIGPSGPRTVAGFLGELIPLTKNIRFEYLLGPIIRGDFFEGN